MATTIQFMFLGCEHSYAATATKVVKAGCPIESSDTAFYGLPGPFRDRLKELADTRYIYNVRGHDFLSHMGQWTSRKSTGPLDTNPTIYGEIRVLQKLAQEDEAKSKRKANLITSFGPGPGSFFADAFRLRRYRWSNLPADLEREIQDQVNVSGYGTIHDVAINAAGGWVMQLDRGSRWIWGGEVPGELTQALKAKPGKASISRLFLNHQHPTEYVLLFSTGEAYVRLHRDFESDLKELIELWATSRKIPLLWHFKPSCKCSSEYQQLRNADYHNRRGAFHSLRGNHELAYQYLREAHRQDPNSPSIRRDYVKALVALRTVRNDPILESCLAALTEGGDLPAHRMAFVDAHQQQQQHQKRGTQDEQAIFRLEYLWMLEMTERGLNVESSTVEAPMNLQGEWSYAMVNTVPDSYLVELDSNTMLVNRGYDPSTVVFELLGDVPAGEPQAGDVTDGVVDELAEAQMSKTGMTRRFRSIFRKKK